MEQKIGKLFVVATPIGNMEDMTFRAVRILSEAEVLACEDTRHTLALLQRQSISIPQIVLSYREQNEESAGRRILSFLKNGKKVALCSDAGFPGISDPGYRIVSETIKEGLDIEVIPGAGAVETALILSGLPTSSYTFKGFPPRKPGARLRFLEIERDLPHTLVIFESPYRVEQFLKAAHEALGDRQASVCIELTKKFERVRRGFLSELAREFENIKVKGEVTVVIAGNNPKFAKTLLEETDGGTIL